MSQTLLILFGGAGPEATLHWARVSRSSGDILQKGEIGPGATAPSATPADTILVLPGSEAQLKSVQLAASSDVQARAAAAYLFEGDLAIEKEHVAFALGAETDGRRLVAAADRRRVQRWIDKCLAAGANPAAIYLDSAIWPVAAGTLQVVDLGNHAIVAGGTLGSYAIEASLAVALLPAWLAQCPDHVATIQMVGVEASGLAGRLAHPAPTVLQMPAPDPLAILCRAACAPPAHTPNLRQGDFAQTKRKGAATGAWGLAAGLLTAAAALQLGVMALDGYRDAQAAAALSRSNEAMFRQLRPGTERINNLRAQLTAALNATQRPATNPVISNSKIVAGVLRSHPDVRLDEMRSENSSGLVAMRFSSPQSPALDAAMADLSAALAGLKIGQMQTSEGRATLTVSVEAT